MPCEASEHIITKASERNKNFYLALCGCVHSEMNYGYGYGGYSLQMWYDHIYYLANSTLPTSKSLEVIYLPENYNCEYPIILSRDKK